MLKKLKKLFKKLEAWLKPWMEFITEVLSGRYGYALLVLIFTTVAVFVGGGYIVGYNMGWYIPGLRVGLGGADVMKVALALGGAVLVVGNMIFFGLRMQKTDIQIKNTERQARQQIDQSQENQFLTELYQSTIMLYASDSTKKFAGIEFLHQLAETHQGNDARVQRVVDVFCGFLRVTGDPLPPEGEKTKETEAEINSRALKSEILNRMGDATHDFYRKTKKNLKGLQLHAPKDEKYHLWGITLSKATMDQAYLTEVNLRGATLTDVKLYQASLTEVNLKGSKLTNVNLWGAKLTGVDLSGATLTDVDLNNATFEKVDLRGATLENTKLKDVDLVEAQLEDADLRGVDVSVAHLVWNMNWERVILTPEQIKQLGRQHIQVTGCYSLPKGAPLPDEVKQRRAKGYS